VIAERDRRGVADGAGTDSSDSGRDDFGRDGVSGLVDFDRAMRARDVSRPGSVEEELALRIVDSLIARAEGRPPRVSP
jgi:hypothetical protein